MTPEQNKALRAAAEHFIACITSLVGALPPLQEDTPPIPCFDLNADAFNKVLDAALYVGPYADPKEILFQGNKIEAIKTIRTLANTGLKEAKQWVDQHWYDVLLLARKRAAAVAPPA